jgi:hypothetical protein
MAMVAFAMRKYVNQIFDTNGKQRTAQHLVEDVVEIFKAWEAGKSSSKLNFMFESKEAGKLCKHLISMFSLKKLKGYSDISSLKDARWAIQHEYAKEKGYPLWSLKYCTSEYNTGKMKELIDNVIKVVGDPESMKNPQLLANTIGGYEELKLEWGNLLIENNGGNYKEGFDNYVKSVDIANVQDNELTDLMDYLQGHLEGEVGLWKELEATPPVIPPVTPHDPSILVEDRGGYDTPITPSNVAEHRKMLLETFKMMPSEELKELMEDVVEKEDGILDILLKYV